MPAPHVIESSVTSVIEQQLTGLSGLLFFNSTSSSTGSVSINLAFENGTDIDIAAVEVQNRISRAEPRLPQEVRDQGINVAKASARTSSWWWRSHRQRSARRSSTTS